MAIPDIRRAPAPVPSIWTAQSRVRMRTLILLRWLAIIGQTVAVLFVGYGIHLSFPIAPAFAIIGVSVLLNLALIALRRSKELAREWQAAAQLGLRHCAARGFAGADGRPAKPVRVFVHRASGGLGHGAAPIRDGDAGRA